VSFASARLPVWDGFGPLPAPAPRFHYIESSLPTPPPPLVPRRPLDAAASNCPADPPPWFPLGHRLPLLPPFSGICLYPQPLKRSLACKRSRFGFRFFVPQALLDSEELALHSRRFSCGASAFLKAATRMFKRREGVLLVFGSFPRGKVAAFPRTCGTLCPGFKYARCFCSTVPSSFSLCPRFAPAGGPATVLCLTSAVRLWPSRVSFSPKFSRRLPPLPLDEAICFFFLTGVSPVSFLVREMASLMHLLPPTTPCVSLFFPSLSSSPSYFAHLLRPTLHFTYPVRLCSRLAEDLATHSGLLLLGSIHPSSLART